MYIKNLVVDEKSTTFASEIVLWCNGSTTVFGSVSGGSNPPGTTEKGGLNRSPFLVVN